MQVENKRENRCLWLFLIEFSAEGIWRKWVLREEHWLLLWGSTRKVEAQEVAVSREETAKGAEGEGEAKTIEGR